MNDKSLRMRIIKKFGVGFYRNIFKEQVGLRCNEIMFGRFYYEKYNKFYYKRKSIGSDQELSKFRKRSHYKALWLRVYKDYGEHVLAGYEDADDYIDALKQERENSYETLSK